MARELKDIIRMTGATTGNDEELETEYEIENLEELVDQFQDSDITLWLSAAGYILLSSAIRKLREAPEEWDTEDREALLSDQEKAIIYGAFLLS